MARRGRSVATDRWYSPRLGQFISHDPLHYVDSTNMYAFAAFDPISSWDPMGLESGGNLAETNETNQKRTDEDESDNNSDVDKFRDGVEDYFMFDDWGMLGESDTWDIAAQDYKKEVKRRFNQPADAANVRNISPFFNDIEGLLNDANRVANALGDPHAMGKLAPELLLKILAVVILHKSSKTGAANGTLMSAAPDPAELLMNANQPFRNGPLTKAGRALTKHPNVVGESGNLLQKLGGAANVNHAATTAVENIIQHGTFTMKATKNYGEIFQYTLENGIGVRFTATNGEFIGFIGRGK